MQLAALVLSFSFALAPPPWPGSGETAAGSGDGFHVSRHAGLAFWSRRTEAGYRLVMRRGRGRARLAPAAPGPFPFDVDAGSDADGRTVAVYSRCRAGRAGDAGRPRRHACDLYRFDPRTGEERGIVALSTPADELRPAIHRGRVAYARLTGAAVDVLVGRRRVAQHVVEEAADGARPAPEDVLGLDFADAGVAFAVRDDMAFGNLMYLRRPGRAVEIVGGGAIGEENDRLVRSPSFAGRHLLWAFANQHPASPARLRGWVVRLDLRTGSKRAARTPAHLLAVAADDARPDGRLLTVTDPSDALARYVFGRQRLRAMRPVFGDVPRGVG